MYILYIIAGIIALILILPLFTRKEYFVERAILINAPKQKVFDYLKNMKNQDQFNKWVMRDPNMKKEYKGTDGTVGFVYAWKGNKEAGEGELEIIKIEEGKKIEIEVRFVRPMPGVAYGKTILTPVSDTQTKVTWSNTARLKYPMNLMITMIEKFLGKDMDVSLNNLKVILEN